MNVSMVTLSMYQECTFENDLLITSSYHALVHNTMCCKTMPTRYFTNKAKLEDELMGIQLIVQEQSQSEVTSPP